MTKEEKEMYIKGSLLTGPKSDLTKRGKKRARSRAQYMFNGKVVCKGTFSLVYDIRRWSMESLRTSMNTPGPALRQHGNTGKKPKHALTFEYVKRVVLFISNYSEEYGIPQLAAPRGRDDTAPTFLHSSMKKQLSDLLVKVRSSPYGKIVFHILKLQHLETMFVLHVKS